MPTPELTDRQKDACHAIVNIFETGRVRGDYGQVTLLPSDPGHLTYGRAQTTLASGNLALLVRSYCDAQGELGGTLVPFLPALDRRDVALDHDDELKRLLRAAGSDPLMRQVQDGFFDRVYWTPALRSAGALGITQPLGVGVVYDSHIHGSFRPMRDRTINRVGEPGSVGETAWIERYVETRRDWLATHGIKILRKTVYRMDAFAKLIAEARWELALPFVVRGVLISEESLTGTTEPVVVSAADDTERLLFLTTPKMRGSDIERLQRLLGFTGAAVDGVFGAHTDLAVRKFQEREGLTIDGKVGGATWAALTDER